MQANFWIVFWVGIGITTWELFFSFISQKTQNIAIGLVFVNFFIIFIFIFEGGYSFLGPYMLIQRYACECVWGRYWYYFHYPFLRKLLKNNKEATISRHKRNLQDMAEYIRYCLKEGDTCFIVSSEAKITNVPFWNKEAIFDWFINQKFEYLVYTEHDKKNNLTINLETTEK